MAEYCHAATNVNRPALDCPNNDADIVRSTSADVGKRSDGRQSLRNLFHTGKRVASVSSICSSAHALVSQRKNGGGERIAERRREQKIKAPNTSINKSKTKHGRK